MVRNRRRNKTIFDETRLGMYLGVHNPALFILLKKVRTKNREERFVIATLISKTHPEILEDNGMLIDLSAFVSRLPYRPATPYFIKQMEEKKKELANIIYKKQ